MEGWALAADDLPHLLHARAAGLLSMVHNDVLWSSVGPALGVGRCSRTRLCYCPLFLSQIWSPRARPVACDAHHMLYAVQGRFLRSLTAAGDGSAAPSLSPGATEGALGSGRGGRPLIGFPLSFPVRFVRLGGFSGYLRWWIWAVLAGAAASSAISAFF